MSTQGKHIYARGAQSGKRVQCNMGAKNHGVILPDAQKVQTVNQVVKAAFGAAGEKCMALCTLLLVGETKSWIPDIIARAKKIKVNAGRQKCYVC